MTSLIWTHSGPGHYKAQLGHYSAHVILARLPLRTESCWTFSILRFRSDGPKPIDYFLPIAFGHRHTLERAQAAASQLLASLADTGCSITNGNTGPDQSRLTQGERP